MPPRAHRVQPAGPVAPPPLALPHGDVPLDFGVAALAEALEEAGEVLLHRLGEAALLDLGLGRADRRRRVRDVLEEGGLDLFRVRNLE